MMTDPIADMLTRLRNANSAYHDSAAMPSSKIKTHIAEILEQQGYIAGWKVNAVEKDGSTRRELVIDLKYGPNRERGLCEFEVVTGWSDHQEDLVTPGSSPA